MLFSRKSAYPGSSFSERSTPGTVGRHPGVIARDICEYKVIGRGCLSDILNGLEQSGLAFRSTEKRPSSGSGGLK